MAVYFKLALIFVALMAIAYAQQTINHDLELAETRMKKPHGDYGDSGHYGGGSSDYGSSGGYGKGKKPKGHKKGHGKGKGTGYSSSGYDSGYGGHSQGGYGGY